jgi:hypothetical protein
MKVFATRDLLIKARPECPRDEVPAPELGAGVVLLLKGLNGRGRDEYEASMVKAKANGKGQEYVLADIRARLAVRVIVDGDGARVLTDADVPVITEWPATLLQRVFEKGKQLSGMSDEDVAEITKNYGAAQSDS